MTEAQMVLIIRDELGFEHARTTDLELARAMADEMGVGAEVEIRYIIYRVTEESLTDPTYDLHND